MITQNTKQWLEMRKSKIGASDAPIIMQKSPWKTPYQLWKEKMSLTESSMNSAMQRGHDLEPIALQCLQEKLGIALRPQVKLHNQRSWMMASVDAVSEDGSVIGEIKCPGKADHEKALSGHLPEHYYPQLQHQMEVCGVEVVNYFSFDGTDGTIVKVYRDGDYIKEMIKQEEKFFECMMNFEPPELISRDYVYRGEARWAKLAEEYKELCALEERKEAIRKELIELAEGQNSMGGGITLSKCTRKGSVDYAKIPELQGLDLEKYRKKSSEYWRIS
jgi:putative phage-type endonuclease